MLTCTFAGHRDISDIQTKAAVMTALYELIEKDIEFCFYTGGMGRFDGMCSQAVRELRKQRPEKQIRLILVEPYMKQSINTDGEWLYKMYDDIIVPEELMGVHYKSAIQLRNRWMIDHSQYLIACVQRNFGGAAATLQYAQRRSITVIRT